MAIQQSIKITADTSTAQSSIAKLNDSLKQTRKESNDATIGIDDLSGGLGGLIQKSNEAGGAGSLLGNSFKGMSSAIAETTKASLAFIATPIGLVLGVIAGAIAVVVSAMKRSEESTNKMKVAFSAFTGILNTFMKVLEPLGKFLIDGIVKGFDLAGKSAEKMMDIVSSGLELLGFEEASKGVRNFTNEIKNGIREAQNLANAEAELEKKQRKSRLTQLEYQKDAEKLRQARDDENKSIGERIKSNEALGGVLRKQLNDELAIAKTALQVANLRIKAEGQTKENLDAQADALTEIADIQERLTGQESEQLQNRISLQKEASEKAREIREKAIENELSKSKQSIELFKAQQSFKKQSLEEEQAFNKKLYEKEISDITLQYKKGKLNKIQFETEKLNATKEFQSKTAELLIADGQRELDIIKNNAQLSLETKLEAELEFQRLRKEQGQINEAEYQQAIFDIQNDFDRQRLEKKLADEALEKERIAIDLENKRATGQLTFEQDIEIQKQQADIKMQEELLQAETTGANKDLIYQKYAKIKSDLDQQVSDREKFLDEQTANAKVQIANTTLGILGSLAKEGSGLAKGIAVAQATINTYQGVTSALSAQSVVPDPIGSVLKFANATAVGVQGFLNVKKILATKPVGTSAGAGGGAGGSAPPPPPPTPSFNLVKGTGSNQIAESLNTGKNPIKAYVVSTDVTTQQGLDRNIQNTAKL